MGNVLIVRQVSRWNISPQLATSPPLISLNSLHHQLVETNSCLLLRGFLNFGRGHQLVETNSCPPKMNAVPELAMIAAASRSG